MCFSHLNFRKTANDLKWSQTHVWRTLFTEMAASSAAVNGRTACLWNKILLFITNQCNLISSERLTKIFSHNSALLRSASVPDCSDCNGWCGSCGRLFSGMFRWRQHALTSAPELWSLSSHYLTKARTCGESESAALQFNSSAEIYKTKTHCYILILWWYTVQIFYLSKWANSNSIFSSSGQHLCIATNSTSLGKAEGRYIPNEHVFWPKDMPLMVPIIYGSKTRYCSINIHLLISTYDTLLLMAVSL